MSKRPAFKKGYAAALREQEKRGVRIIARLPHFRIMPLEALARVSERVVDRSARRVVEGSTGKPENHDDYA